MAAKKQIQVVDASITDAQVPNVGNKFMDVALISMMVPMDDPYKDDCVWGLPTIFWGASGIAKSARIHQASSACSLVCRVLFPGQKQPEDFSGVLVPTGDGKVVTQCLLPAVRELNKLGKGVIFIDEAGGATPATQGAMLGFVNDRIAGDEPIAPGIRIMLASNPPKLSAGGWALDAPMANRMAHFQVQCPSPAEWIEWLTSEGVEKTTDVEASEKKLKSNWGPANSYTKGLVAGFIRDRQSLLHVQPLPTVPQSSYCWPSPRTWRYVIQAVSTIKALSMDDTLEHLFIESLVGEGAAAEFIHWVKANDLPLPEEVLIKGWDPDGRRLDVTMAVTTAVSSYVIGLKDVQERQEMAAAAWRYLMKVIDSGNPDIVLPGASTLVRAGLARQGDTTAELKKACEPVILALAKMKMIDYVTAQQLDT